MGRWKLALCALVCTVATFFYCSIFCDGLSIERAFRCALINRSNLRARAHEIRQREFEQYTELGELLPEITVENFFLTGTPGTFGKHEIDINVKQRLVDFGGVLHGYSAARELTRVSEYECQLARDVVQRDVEKSFLQLWRLQREQIAVKARLCASDKKRWQAESRGQVGEVDCAEVAQELAKDAQIFAEAKNYTDDVFVGEQRVSRSLESEFDGNFDDCSVQAFVERSIACSDMYSLDFYLERSRWNRKEILIKDAQVCSEEHRVTHEASTYLPTLSFMARFNRSGISALFSRNGTPVDPATCQGCCAVRDTRGVTTRSIWRLGVQLDWKFDGLVAVHRTSAAQESVARLLAERRDVVCDVRLEVEEGYATVQQSRNDMEAAREEYRAAEQTYALREAEFAVGLITKVDFAAAQRDFEDTKFALEKSEITVAGSYRDLLFRSGYPEVPMKEVVVA